MKKIFSILFMSMLAPLLAQAQTMTYEQFIESVARNNASYLAQKYDVDVATASLQASRVFNDPELSVSYGNNQDWFMQMGQSVEVELSYDLDLSGQRRARMGVAMSEKEMTEASVNAFFSTLKLEASQAYAEAWRLRRSVDIMQQSYDDMARIARSDSLRMSLGDVSRADAIQSKLEAQTLYGDLLTLKADYANALMNLSYLCGGESVTGVAESNLPSRRLPYSDSELVELATANRADLKTAEISKTLSSNNLKLVRASRSFDLGLSVGYSYNTEVRNEIAPAPKFNGLSVGVTIPLKFSSINRGELNAARTQVLQSEKYYDDAVMQVRTEVAQARNSLDAARSILSQYDEKMLSDAKEIMESRNAGYIKGETSLLELLTAQQTYRDVMQAYIDALCNVFVCEAEMEHAVGYTVE